MGTPENEVKKPRRRFGCLTVIGLLALVIVIGTLASSGGEKDSKPASGSQSSPSTPIEKKADLELVEAHSENDKYVRYIVGTVKNNSKRQYGYVQVEINLYDKSGAQVGSTLANTNNLEPGGTWKFKAVVLEDNATNFKVKGVTGW